MWSADNSVQGSGGFLDQTYNGQSNQQPNKTDAVRGNAVVPLMIGHLLDDNPDTLNLWGTPIKLMTLVGFVRKCDRASTKISYELVDETGSIMAYQWVEDESENLVIVQPGTYARVVGSPREQGDSRHIFVLKIEPVVNLAELCEHLLEVTVGCLKGEELMTDTEPGKAPSAGMEETALEGYHGMNKEQAMVFKMVQSHSDSESGVEREILQSKVPASLRGKLDDILEFLVFEGHIYTTCTADHFKTT